MTGYATEPLQRRVRMRLGTAQHLDIGDHTIVLPPSHKLPYYVKRDPRYDVYAGEVLQRFAAECSSVRVIDIGANVGDTATIALTAAKNISVTSVEGNPGFASFARKNLTAFGERSELIEKFVGPIATINGTYENDGSTGGFGPGATSASATAATEWISPDALLAEAADADLIIWKSDTDGLDIHLLVEYFAAINAKCGVIWFEYDPFETLGDVADISSLARLLDASGRGLVFYDNLGNCMLSVKPGGDVERTMADLTAWLGEQRENHMEVAYFDIWAIAAELWFERERPEIEVRHT